MAEMKRMPTLLDLSLPLSEDLPCYWSTHQPFQRKVWNWFASELSAAGPVYNRSGPYTTSWMAIDEHAGTHFDAPRHFIPPPGSGLPSAGPAGDITAEKVPLEQLMGPAAVIGVPPVLDEAAEPGISRFIGPGVVAAWEEQHGEIEAGQIVLFNTGWDRYYLRGAAGADYLHNVVVTRYSPGWPAPNVETIDYLLRRGVTCMGTDAPSMGAAHDGAPVHIFALKAGAVFIECLTGLDRVPPRGAWFCFLPLKIELGTGAPGRAIAFIDGQPESWGV